MSVLEGIGNESQIPEMEMKLGEQVDEDIIKIDGIPYEFWKMLAGDPRYRLEQSKGTTVGEDEAPDTIKLLTSVYVDIEKYGVHLDLDFAEGWMCPIYKKKDK